MPPPTSLPDILTWAAVAGGLGLSPLWPGTAGAALGLLVALALDRARLRLRWRAAITTALLLAAVPICTAGERGLGGHDDPRIVADEAAAMPLATMLLPIARHPLLAGGVFLTNRILDGLKPFPAGPAERLPRGLGIVMDDVVAAAWTLLPWWAGWAGWRIRARRRRSRSRSHSHSRERAAGPGIRPPRG